MSDLDPQHPQHPQDPTGQLADFAAGLQFAAIPDAVVRRTEDLFLDWFGSAHDGGGDRFELQAGGKVGEVGGRVWEGL